MLKSSTRITDRRGLSFIELMVTVGIIELMVTVGIIGILSAMAVPTYSKLRHRFFDARALSDVANAARAIEAMDSKTSFNVSLLGPGAIKELPGPRISKGVTLTVTRTVAANGRVTYRVTGKHGSGTGALYIFTGGKVFATGAKL